MKKEFLLFLTLFFALFTSLKDPDFWWHLKYGELIFTTHSIPLSDTFSYTFTGYTWANSYWLSDLFMFLLTKNFLPMGLSIKEGYMTMMAPNFIVVPLVFSALLSLALVLVTRNLKNFPARFLALLVSLIGITYFSVSLRPMMFSVIFLALIWWILLFDEFKNYLVLLPFVFLLWANLHADFVIGLGVFSVYIFVELTKILQKKIKFRNFLETFLIWLTSIIVTLVNPYGIFLYKTLWDDIKVLFFGSVGISEWSPLVGGLHNVQFIYAIFLISLTLWVLLNNLNLSAVSKNSSHLLMPNKQDKKENSLFIYIILLPLFIVSFKSVYFLRILAIFSIPFVYLFFDQLFELIKDVILTKYIKVYSVLTCTLLFCALALNFVTSALAYSNLNMATAYSSGSFPYAAVEFIKVSKPYGNMFNSYSWGGYLIYFLPEYKVFIDGRMTAWSWPKGAMVGEESGTVEGNIETNIKDRKVLDTYEKFTEAKDIKFVEDMIQKYRISWVLVSPHDGVAKYLASRSDWRVVYEDKVAVVLFKT